MQALASPSLCTTIEPPSFAPAKAVRLLEDNHTLIKQRYMRLQRRERQGGREGGREEGREGGRVGGREGGSDRGSGISCVVCG